MIQGQPRYASAWLDGRVQRPQPGPLQRARRWLPAVLLLTVSVASYVSVLALVLLPAAGLSRQEGYDAQLEELSPVVALAILLLYHALAALAAVSFIATARLVPGHIPLWLFSREPGDQAYFHNVLQAVEKKLDGSLRFCRKCGAFKPDRAHHSHELGMCVLAYQHWGLHCNNAIGFYNYKAYLLALLYTGALHLLTAALFAPGVLAGWAWVDVPDFHPLPWRARAGAPQRVHVAAAALWWGGSGAEYACAWTNMLVSAAIAGCALSWLAFHLAITAQGLAAPALLRKVGCARNKPPKPPLPRRPFDFGTRGNLIKVFGRHPFLWLLPTNQGIEGNGIFFEIAASESTESSLFSK